MKVITRSIVIAGPIFHMSSYDLWALGPDSIHVNSYGFAALGTDSIRIRMVLGLWPRFHVISSGS